jgi:hypothetical protein
MYPQENSSVSPLFLSDNAAEEALHFHRKRKPCIIFTSFLPKFPANLPFCWENFLHIFSKKFQQEMSFLLGPLLISVSVVMRDQGARSTVQNMYIETGWRHYPVALSASNGRKKKMYCRPCRPRKYWDILLVIFYLLENCLYCICAWFCLYVCHSWRIQYCRIAVTNRVVFAIALPICATKSPYAAFSHIWCVRGLTCCIIL